MTKKYSFDWDECLRNETYEKVLDGMRGSRLLIPTMYSPDKRLIYLKTYDVDFHTDDVDTLNKILDELYVSLQNEASNIDWSFEQLYLLEVDYLTIWSILRDQQALPDDYMYPEYYLKKVTRMIGGRDKENLAEI